MNTSTRWTLTGIISAAIAAVTLVLVGFVIPQPGSTQWTPDANGVLAGKSVAHYAAYDVACVIVVAGIVLALVFLGIGAMLRRHEA